LGTSLPGDHRVHHPDIPVVLRATHNEEYRHRAIRMADWLLEQQLAQGAFPIGPLWPDWERSPLVFDTGQILQGLVHIYQETNDSRYLAAADRAANWLVEVQDPDGAWRRFTSLGSSTLTTYGLRGQCLNWRP